MLDCLGRGEFSLLSLVCSAALAICAAQASKGMGVTGTGSTLSKRQRQTGAEQACQRARVCAGATQGTHAQGSDAFKERTDRLGFNLRVPADWRLNSRGLA